MTTAEHHREPPPSRSAAERRAHPQRRARSPPLLLPPRGWDGCTATVCKWASTSCPRAVAACWRSASGAACSFRRLTRRYPEYTGTDLTLASGLDKLVAPGCRATFRRADLLRDGDLPAAHFDAIVCFSVLEHIADSDAAARGLARALAPGGVLVTGYPMVSRLMTRAFDAIGFPRDRRSSRQHARAHRIAARSRASFTRRPRRLSACRPRRRRALSMRGLDEVTRRGPGR
jgi:SAM-dependent methyltransferase